MTRADRSTGPDSSVAGSVKAGAALIVLIVVLALLAAGCSGNPTGPTTSPHPTPPPAPACITVHHDAECTLQPGPAGLQLVCTPARDEQVCK